MGRAEYRAVELDVARSIQSLAFRVRTAYYRLLAAKQRLAMGRQQPAAAKAGRDMAGRLRDAGNIRELRKLGEEALYEQARLAVSAAELAVLSQRQSLNMLMGLSGLEPAWKAPSALPDPIANLSTAEEILGSALDKSLRLAVIRARIESARSQLTLARVKSLVEDTDANAHSGSGKDKSRT